ncbi:MAG: hypothetical protein NT116_03210, partial [Candidatus Parcubacteria bacterium]|nr:hypothetical protein [Candidatus Parcubacteria bacterium]
SHQLFDSINGIEETLQTIALKNALSSIPGLTTATIVANKLVGSSGTIGMNMVDQNDIVTQVVSSPTNSLVTQVVSLPTDSTTGLALLGLSLLGIALLSATIRYFTKTVVKVEKEKYIRDINSIPKPFLRKILGNTGLFGEYGELARCGKCIENTCIEEDGEEWCEVLEKPDFKSGGCSIDDYKSESRWLGFGGTKHKIRCQLSTKKARELLYESSINMETDVVNKLREERQRMVKRVREEAESSESDGDTKTNKKQRLVEIEPDNLANIAKEKRQRW